MSAPTLATALQVVLRRMAVLDEYTATKVQRALLHARLPGAPLEEIALDLAEWLDHSPAKRTPQPSRLTVLRLVHTAAQQGGAA